MDDNGADSMTDAATFETRFDAAKLVLIRRFRWARRTLMSLQPVEVQQGTLAVDRFHRLYFNRTAVDGWTDTEFVGAVWHEANHLLRRHPDRMSDTVMFKDRKLANIAADCEINSEIGVTLPAGVFYPETVNLDRGGYAERYYRELREQDAQQDKQQSGDAEDDGSNPDDEWDDDDETNDDGESRSNENDDSSDSDDGAGDESDSDDESDDGNGGESEGDDEGDADAGDDGADDGSDGEDADGDGSGSGDDGEDGEPGGTPGGGNSDNPQQRPSDSWEDPGCGSGAGGNDENELPPPSDDEQADIEREERKQAKETLDASDDNTGGYSPGGKPATGIVDAARRLLGIGTHNWRATFATVVRNAMEQATDEAEDYSFKRRSRRAEAAAPGMIPGSFRPIPKLAVVVDSSGSMNEAKVTAATSEVRGILERLAIPSFAAFCYSNKLDGSVTVSSVADVRKLLETASGGGTNMMDAARHAIGTGAEVVVILTDCQCSWDETAPAFGVPVIVGGIDAGSYAERMPGWVTFVAIGSPTERTAT